MERKNSSSLTEGVVFLVLLGIDELLVPVLVQEAEAALLEDFQELIAVEDEAVLLSLSLDLARKKTEGPPRSFHGIAGEQVGEGLLGREKLLFHMAYASTKKYNWKDMKIDYLPYLRKKVGHDLVLSVGLSVLLVDEKRQLVLLEKRTDNGLYCLPGGSIDLGEKVLEGARRELFEETGITVGSLSLFLILSGEQARLSYPNGDVTEYCDLIFFSPIDSTAVCPRKDKESTAVDFVPLSALPPKESFLRGTWRILEKYLSGNHELEID